jgi:putative ATP-dependent endonuclease of the OLD family
MKIRKWKIQGYKSIQDANFQPSDLNVLIGKNNSGKSNVLDSMIDYIDLFNDDLNKSDWYTDHLTRRTNQHEIVYDVVFEFSHQEHSELIDELANRDVLFGDQPQEFKDNGYLKKLKHEFHITNRGKVSKDTFKTNVEGQMVDLSRGTGFDREALILDNLSTTTYRSVDYRLDLSFRNRLENSLATWRNVRSLRKPKGVLDFLRKREVGEAGEQLAQVLGTLKINDPAIFDEISDSYSSIIEGVTNVEIRLINDNEVTVEVFEDGYTDSFELEEISTGSKQILILITAIYQAKYKSDVLLIEEPEQNLHPGAEQFVYDLLADLSANGVQVFVTTHSDKFVDQSGLEDITSIYRNNENVTEFKRVEETKVDETLSMLGYEKSDVYYSNAVVFVEDQSDKVVLEQFAATLGYSLQEKGIQFIRVQGDNLFADAEPMLKVIHQLRLPYLFVLDSDDKDPEQKAQNVATKIGVSPDTVYVLQEPNIEAYLVSNPEVIARAFNADVDTVETCLSEAGKRNFSNTLNRISKQLVGQSMNKKAINGMIARHATEDEIPEELTNLLTRIDNLGYNASD